jgi:nitrogen fixation/metabolism regulation signal transduction histidine kinase
MKKTIKISAIILTSYLLTSCGARKVNKETLKEDVKTNTAVLSNEKSKDSSMVETNETISNKLNFELKTNEFNFEPFDNEKPFFIGGKEYSNVKVVSKESNTKITQEFDLFKKQVEQRFLENENTIETLTQENRSLKSNVKQVDKKESLSGIIFNLSLLLLLLIAIYIAYRYFKNKLKL